MRGFAITTRKYCLALIAAAALFAAPAFAQVEKDTIPKAASNGNYGYDAGTHGLDAPLTVGNFSITAWNICRFVDNNSTASDLLIPFRTSGEWDSFIANSWRNNPIALDMCRTAVGFPAVIDYTPGFVPGELVNLTVSPIISVTPPSIMRVDTRSPAALAAFLAQPPVSYPQAFPMQRNDCALIAYPDGSTKNVCVRWDWNELLTANLAYNIPAASENVATLQAEAKNPAAGEAGSWSAPMIVNGGCPGVPAGTLFGGGGMMPPTPPASCAPAFTPPLMRSCPPSLASGTHHWVDSHPGQTLLPCAAGYVSDPSDPYRDDYMVQEQYECVDGADYPETPTQDVGDTYNGHCLPIVNGACGSDNGASLDASPVNLCSSGTPTGVSGFWNWSCQGQNTGTTASCHANPPACIPGVANNTAIPWMGAIWINGCDAPAVDGQCGSAQNQTFYSDPMASGANLCASGGAFSYNVDSGTGNVTWGCAGSGPGAANASCEAHNCTASIQTQSVDMECDSIGYAWTACTVNTNAVGIVSITPTGVSSACNSKHSPQSNYACNAYGPTADPATGRLNFGGASANQIFVDGGLRATFHVVYQVPVDTCSTCSTVSENINCSSNSYRYTECGLSHAASSIQSINLNAIYSSCHEAAPYDCASYPGTNYGVAGDNNLFVNYGLRGNFTVTYTSCNNGY